MKTEQQLDLIEKKPQHGGARIGSGRKRKRPTKAVRVPAEYEHTLKHVVEFLDQVQAGEATLFQSEYLSEELVIQLSRQRGKFTVVFEPKG